MISRSWMSCVAIVACLLLCAANRVLGQLSDAGVVSGGIVIDGVVEGDAGVVSGGSGGRFVKLKRIGGRSMR